MNAIFIHIPKAAGTSIEKSLGFIRARTPARFKNLFNNKSGMYSFGHIEVRKRLADGSISKEFYDSAFKFCFCRNPYDRAVSHYFYARKRHPKEFSPKVSFIDFTRTLGNYGRMFRLQSYYVEKLEFDFIGRFERLKEDFNYIANHLGINAELIKDNATKHKPYWEYYNSESIENVKKFYDKDFKRFGYDNRLFPIL